MDSSVEKIMSVIESSYESKSSPLTQPITGMETLLTNGESMQSIVEPLLMNQEMEVKQNKSETFLQKQEKSMENIVESFLPNQEESKEKDVEILLQNQESNQNKAKPSQQNPEEESKQKKIEPLKKEPFRKIGPGRNVEPIKKKEPLKKVETLKVEPFRKMGPIRKVEPLKKIDALIIEEPLKKVEPVKKVKPLKVVEEKDKKCNNVSTKLLEFVKRKANKPKVGVVFLPYSEDKLILEHEQNTEKGRGREVEVNEPSKKRGKSSISPQKPDMETVPKRHCGRRRQPKRSTRSLTKKKSRYDNSSDSDSASNDYEGYDMVETAAPALKCTPPKGQKMSFSEMMELSKSNILKHQSLLDRHSSSKRASEANQKYEPKRKRVKTSTSNENDLSSLVNKLKEIDFKDRRNVKKVSFDPKIIKVKIRHPTLSFLERHYIKSRGCFLVRNYKKIRCHAKEILSRVVIKKWKSFPALTGFSKESRLKKKLRLERATGKMKQSFTKIPLQLTYPIQELSIYEREFVLQERVFLLRNFHRMYHIINSRVFWKPSIRRRYLNTKIPQIILDSRDDKLTDFFPDPAKLASAPHSVKVDNFKGCHFYTVQ